MINISSTINNISIYSSSFYGSYGTASSVILVEDLTLEETDISTLFSKQDENKYYSEFFLDLTSIELKNTLYTIKIKNGNDVILSERARVITDALISPNVPLSNNFTVIKL